MTANQINMHGKIYTLYDEIVRTKEQAKSEASDIREKGQVAFLNPRKRKDMETIYYIYVAEKTIRVKKPKQKEVIQELDNQANHSVDEINEFIDGEVEVLEAIDEVKNGFKLCPFCQTSFKPKNSRQIYDKKECSNQVKALKRAANKANKSNKK